MQYRVAVANINNRLTGKWNYEFYYGPSHLIISFLGSLIPVSLRFEKRDKDKVTFN